MLNTVFFKLGNVGASFTCNVKLAEEKFDFSPFSTSGEHVDFTLNYSFVDSATFASATQNASLEADVSESHNSKQYIIEDNAIIHKDFDKNTCDIITCSTQHVEREGKDTLYFSMEAKILANFSFLASQLSIKHNAIILHGSGLVRNNNAYIFLARGEGGKTTLVKKNSAFHVLSDDQIFFSALPSGRIEVDATPFGTITDGPAPSTIKGIFLLRKSSTHEINRADNLNLLLSFLYDNAAVFTSLPKQLRKSAFQLLHKIAFSAPVFELKTHYGHIDWDYLDECVEAAEKEAARSGIPLHKDLKSRTKTNIAQA